MKAEGCVQSSDNAWFEKPHDFITNNMRDLGIQSIKSYFKENIEKTNIPICLLNYCNIDDVPNFSFVCFRGSVFDMRNPSFAPRKLKISQNDGTTQEKISLFCNSLEIDGEIDYQFEDLVQKQQIELHSPLCENDWVAEALKPKFGVANSSTTVDKVFIEMYEELDSFKIHDFVEVYGIFERLSRIEDETTLNQLKHKDIDSLKSCELSKNPPFVLHSLFYRMIPIPNPYYGIYLANFDYEACRKGVLDTLTFVLQGDELAAKYLLLNIISHVSFRKLERIIGKFTLNLCLSTDLTSENENQDLPNIICNTLKNFLSHSQIFNLSHSNLDLSDMPLSRNYEDGTLNGSSLFNCNGTHLIIDECDLAQGSLSESATKNIMFLRDLISDQKTSIDFNFYRLNYDCDIPTLSISRGRSIFTSDWHIEWEPLPNFQASNPSMVSVDSIRKYFAAIRSLTFEIPKNEETQIQLFLSNPDFISYLDLNEDGIHALLTMTRLMTLSYGRETLDLEIWKEVVEMNYMKNCRLKKNKRSF